MSKSPSKPQLIVIPISHFCEKARWALDRSGLPYEERGTAQVLHRFALKSVGAGRTTPVLQLPGGDLIEGSDAIVRHVDAELARRQVGHVARLRPEDPQQRRAIDDWVDRLDTHFGPLVRRWAYHNIMLSFPMVARHGLHGLPWSHRAFLLSGWPVLSRALRRYMLVTPESSAAAEEGIWETFNDVEEALKGPDGPRRFLVGDRFSAADLTFAALAAATVRPTNYGYPLPGLDALPPSAAAKVRLFRKHPAGQFALKLYLHER